VVTDIRLFVSVQYYIVRFVISNIRLTLGGCTTNHVSMTFVISRESEVDRALVSSQLVRVVVACVHPRRVVRGSAPCTDQMMKKMKRRTTTTFLDQVNVARLSLQSHV